MIRVVIADDHHLVRQGIRALLEKAKEVDVVGEAANGHEAVALVEKFAPDVLVTDIAMARLDGIQTIKRIEAFKLDTKVIVLSMYSDPTLVRQALRSGARGYLIKSSVMEELLLAIQAAMRDEVYLSPGVSQPMLTEFLQTEDEDTDLTDVLTPREREVLQLVTEGHTSKTIAELLNTSQKTIEKHRTNIMAKLNVNDLANLVRIAIKHGLVFLDE